MAFVLEVTGNYSYTAWLSPTLHSVILTLTNRWLLPDDQLCLTKTFGIFASAARGTQIMGYFDSEGLEEGLLHARLGSLNRITAECMAVTVGYRAYCFKTLVEPSCTKRHEWLRVEIINRLRSKSIRHASFNPGRSQMGQLGLTFLSITLVL